MTGKKSLKPCRWKIESTCMRKTIKEGKKTVENKKDIQEKKEDEKQKEEEKGEEN